MSEDNPSRSRRNVLKKIGATAAALTVGATGSAAANEWSTQANKNHYIKFKIDPDESGQHEYSVVLPDPEPHYNNVEEDSPLAGGDSVEEEVTYTEVDGKLHGGSDPFYDEYRFNYESGDFNWDDPDNYADSTIKVVVDGKTVQNG